MSMYEVVVTKGNAEYFKITVCIFIKYNQPHLQNNCYGHDSFGDEVSSIVKLSRNFIK